jgi:organic radical activating enzyme
MDTFCVLPWYSKEFFKNSTSTCCLLPSGTDISQLKQDLLAGIKSPACNTCWKVEASGAKSRRQMENVFLDYKLDRDIDKLRDDCVNGVSSSLVYQIYTSNLCNQACVTCNSGCSTKWAEIEKKMSIIPKPAFYSSIQDLDVNYKTAKRIELLGGEPLFDPRTFKVLEQLIEHNNTDCYISLITNGSITLTTEYQSLLSKFSDLNICVSIDGIGPVFEYMRWPAKWDVLTQNVDQYKTVSKSVSVSYTISSLNAAYYNETVEWFKQQNLSYNHNIVTNVDWLSLHSAPVKLKQHLREKNNIVSSLLSDSKGVDIKLYADKINQQDQAKRIKLADYMPEVAEIIFSN